MAWGMHTTTVNHFQGCFFFFFVYFTKKGNTENKLTFQSWPAWRQLAHSLRDPRAPRAGAAVCGEREVTGRYGAP